MSSVVFGPEVKPEVHRSPPNLSADPVPHCDAKGQLAEGWAEEWRQ